MKSLSIICVCLILVSGSLSTSLCSAPISSQTKIISDLIKIQQTNVSHLSPTPVVQPPKPTPTVAPQTQQLNYSYSYTYNYDKAFPPFQSQPSQQQVQPVPAIGINGFDFQPSSVIGAEITVSQNREERIGFKIVMNKNSNWKKITLNFLVTDRPDIQIGTFDLATPVTTESFKVDYKFRNNWANADLLKYKVFISGFNMKTTEKSSMRLNLERADLTPTSLSILYSTSKQTSTIINSLSLSVILFDGENPAFRYAQGIVSQNYLSTKISIQVPKKGVSELRNFIIGLTSFDVQSNAPISVYSRMDEKFMIQVGPGVSECEVNLVTISYLILSVYPQCGACNPNTINFNNSCTQKCPEGYYIRNGACIQRQCQSGFFMSSNKCAKCPKYSDIKQCNNACPQGKKLQGEDCYSICTDINEIYSYGNCVCVDGYNRIGGRCGKCPKGTRYSYSQGKCQSICPANSIFVEEGEFCQCFQGYNMIHGFCKKCVAGEVFDRTWGVCHPVCGENAEFNGKACVCNFGFYLIDGQCLRCKEGTHFDQQYGVCRSNCYESQIWQTNQCVCAPQYFRIDGKCKKCYGQQVYEPSTQSCREKCKNGQVWITNKCQCLPGSYIINNSCQLCPVQAEYNPETQKCQPICKKQYEQYYYGKCRCVRGFQLSNQKCLPKKCPQNSKYIASSSSCSCLSGFTLSKQTGQCQPIPTCPENSNSVLGICICNSGYSLSADGKTCKKCSAQYNQIYNGIQCVCRDGYVRGAEGKCGVIVIPKRCGQGEYYDQAGKCCFCIDGFVRVNGVCVRVPTCGNNAYWNGQYCSCKTGFVLGRSGICEKIDVPVKPTYPSIPLTPEKPPKQVIIIPVNPGPITPPIKPVKPTKPQVIVVPIPSVPTIPTIPTQPELPELPELPDKIPIVPTFPERPVIPSVPSIPLIPQKPAIPSIPLPPYTPPTPQIPSQPAQPPTAPKIPKCPYNSKFNGVKCICNPNFFQLSPGLCATCPPSMFWNGRKCSYSPSCWSGYKWDSVAQCCFPIEIECPPNSKWNGQSCQCFAGWNAIQGGKRCIKCQVELGYQFDGNGCVRVPQPVVCYGMNRIAIGRECVCRAGTHQYEGNCIQCVYPTVWNGYFCQGNNDGCFTVPYSKINPTNKKCECIKGFRAVQGTCVPYFGFINGQYSNPYSSWTFQTSNQWNEWNRIAAIRNRQLSQPQTPGSIFLGDKWSQQWNNQFLNKAMAGTVIDSRYYGEFWNQYGYSVVPNINGYGYGSGYGNGYAYGFGWGNDGWNTNGGGFGWSNDASGYRHGYGSGSSWGSGVSVGTVGFEVSANVSFESSGIRGHH